MTITGEMLIGSQRVRGKDATLHAFNPATGLTLEPAFGGGSAHEVDAACQLALTAFRPFRELPLEKRAAFLEAIAEGLISLGEELVDRVCAETGLPKARVEGERGRTAGQLRLFADVVRSGHFLDIVIEHALPARQPVPRPDLRQRRFPLGPVAVFGASNFPLAFSVAGGDTASAFAAGCPVVVKAHPAHLGTSELVGRVIQRAAQNTGMPEGVFSLLIGEGNAVGEALVAHPAIRAVGFTGSRRGGLALVEIAQRRPVPIPMYAEMSSINPLIIFPAALSARADAIARGFADSLVLGAGQFCTNPGLVIGIEGPALDDFATAASSYLSQKVAATMLTPPISKAFSNGVSVLESRPGVTRLARGQTPSSDNQAEAALFRTNAETLLDDHVLQGEVFGPSSIVVGCKNFADLQRVVTRLEGQLTASIHVEPDDYEQARQLIPDLEAIAGRILVNGFPTGVDVGYAMVHGGPFPATSDVRTTSVGAKAIERFLRPVCYQDMPNALLPGALLDGVALPKRVVSD
jgi:NADP-dependent aldehyde dehydrogenase